MPDSLVIRPAVVADATVIAGHRVAMFRDMGSLLPQDEAALHSAAERFLADALADGRYVAWLLTPFDRPLTVVGGAGVLLRRGLPGPLPGGGVADGRQALVLNVYTDPAWRRRGIAETLMRELLDWVSAQGIDTVVLHASSAGRPLYERFGFAGTNEMRLHIVPTPTSAAPHGATGVVDAMLPRR